MRLGDRVRDWTTHNEPWCIATLGHELGDARARRSRSGRGAADVPPPPALPRLGVAGPPPEQPGRRVGIVLNPSPAYPASASEADREPPGASTASSTAGTSTRSSSAATRRMRWRIACATGTCRTAAMPWVAGRRHEGDRGPARLPGDQLLQPRRPAQRPDPRGRERAPLRRRGPAEERTDMGWEVYPQGLHDLLVGIHREYRPPASTSPSAVRPSTRRRGRRGASRTPAGSSSCASTCWRPTAPSPTACPWPASSCGPCSTTSSGRTATPSASASSGSIAPRSERILKDSALWYRDVIAANAVEDGAPRVMRRLA